MIGAIATVIAAAFTIFIEWPRFRERWRTISIMSIVARMLVIVGVLGILMALVSAVVLQGQPSGERLVMLGIGLSALSNGMLFLPAGIRIPKFSDRLFIVGVAVLSLFFGARMLFSAINH
ncbi:MAG: hypothetical protein H0X37_11695 [Herpetosiphonaceae bacterium]|nr:hypothetical protein [Herpetosiphonaceae bacterium]